MHATEIPTRFESVLTLDPSDSEYSEEQRQSALYGVPHLQPSQYQYPPPAQPLYNQSYHPAGGHIVSQPAMPQPIIGQPQPLLTIRPQPMQPPPVYYVPYYPRVNPNPPMSPAAPLPSHVPHGPQHSSYPENMRGTEQSEGVVLVGLPSEGALETFPEDLELFEMEDRSGHTDKQIELSQYN